MKMSTAKKYYSEKANRFLFFVTFCFTLLLTVACGAVFAEGNNEGATTVLQLLYLYCNFVFILYMIRNQ